MNGVMLPVNLHKMCALFFFLLHAGISAALFCDQSCEPVCQPWIPIGSCERNTEPVVLNTIVAGKPITILQCHKLEPDIFAPYCPGNIERVTDEGSDGANISFSVIDDVDEHPSMRCSHVSGMKFPVGQTNVTCQLEDSTNNRRNCSFFIIVIDNTPPTMICEDKTYSTNGTSKSNLTIVPIVYDDADISPSVICNASNRDLNNDFDNDFALGLTRVSCKATDYSGNENSCSFIVSIVGHRPAVFVLNGQHYRIRVGNTSLSPFTTLLMSPAVIEAFAFDPVDQRLFYSSEEVQLFRWDTLGLGDEIPNLMDIINRAAKSVAVDQIGRMLYAVARGNTIHAVNLPDADFYWTITTDIEVQHVAVAHVSDRSYLLVTNTTAIYRMMVDGSDQKILLYDDSLSIMGVAWDRKGQRIFFTSSPALQNSTIEVIDVNGGNRTVLLERSDIAPRGVAYHDGYVYWNSILASAKKYGRGIGVIPADVENAQEFDFTAVAWDFHDIMIRHDVADNTYLKD